MVAQIVGPAMTSDDQLARSLEWVSQRTSYFTPRVAVFRGGEVDNLKHCSELVLVLNLLCSQDFETNFANRVMETLWFTAFAKGTLLRDLLIVRPDMLMAVSTYTNFHECGFVNQDVLALARNFSTMSWIDRLPIPMWRTLDILNSMTRLGLGRFPENARERTWIASMPPPSIITIEIAYAITHEIFYLCDFGRSPERLLPADRVYLAMALPLWQAYFRSENDPDICAELALAEFYVLGSINVESIQFCTHTQCPDGSFAGPARVSKDIRTPDDGLNTFRRNYHTTLVMIILLSTLQGHFK